MVNEQNLINLINNKKTVEEVREIDNKYEIPSFEEFMKIYEDDSNLNYDDLRGGNVGTPKGYGSAMIAENEENMGIMNTVVNTVKNMRIRLSSQNEWAKHKVGEAASTSEDAKEAWKVIGDFGRDLAQGEVIGKVGGKVADKLISSGKEVADITLTYGTPTGQFTAHEIHKANGVDYNPDKNPSCSFEPNRKIFTCFTCGFKASDIFNFWAQYQKITLEAAAEEIGQMGYFPLSILREKKQEEQKEKNKVFYLLSLITDIYQHNLLTQAGREDLLVTNLVLVTENNRVCDFFPTQHLIIPLTNSESKIVAFAARKIGEIPTGEGKYKYLPSYQYYQKSSLLYNYPTAKKNRTEECYLVEGFFDVISLHKLGIENCLALLGTNLSETQIKLLIELKKRIILFLDSDKAGREAAVNVAVKLLLKEVDCEVIKGNYEGDPDEVCQQQTKEKVGNNPQRISRFVSEMAEVFRKFKPSIYDFLITKISSLVG
ncbi:602_t:CDS:2 [Funneliformis geosporum]|nr:602_t:CDS:2 [Funneliformis geosporum]